MSQGYLERVAQIGCEDVNVVSCQVVCALGIDGLEELPERLRLFLVEPQR